MTTATDKQLVITKPAAIAPLVEVGQVANQHAAAATFRDYASRKSVNTLSAQLNDLRTFARYLDMVAVEVEPEALQAQPEAWAGLTWGLVEGFVKWMLGEGYAVSTVNRKLSTVKTYAQLATKAGVISSDEMALIKAVKGYSSTEGKRLDERRPISRMATGQKAKAVSIGPAHYKSLVEQPESPQGLRDAVMMRLLLDYGLRVGELARLKVDDVDIDGRILTVYRPKVDITSRFQLGKTPETFQAVKGWVEDHCAPGQEYLLRGSRKDGSLTDGRMSERAIKARVGILGSWAGLEGLSPHDCRHYCATQIAATSSVDALLEFFGWTSASTAMRYIEAGRYADEKVKR